MAWMCGLAQPKSLLVLFFRKEHFLCFDWRPAPEDGGADAHMGGAEADGGLEIAGHAHRQNGQGVARAHVGQRLEEAVGRFAGGRDAHQAAQAFAEPGAAGVDEGVRLGQADARFLRLVADIDLDQQVRQAPEFLGGDFDGVGEARAVEAFDGVGEADGFLGLVGLQGADQVQAQRGVGGAQGGEFGGRFLNAVFAEAELAGGDGGGDGFGGVGFRHGDQCYMGGVAASGARGGGDAGEHGIECRAEGFGHGCKAGGMGARGQGAA